jgi:hypothetical protein
MGIPESGHYKKMKQLTEVYEIGEIYVSRTLDQSYYEMMGNTESRDKDQVVYRYTCGTITSLKEGSANEIETDPVTPGLRLLMVSQFWLWKIDQSRFLTK